MKDETLSLLREGYGFLSARAPSHGSRDLRIAGLRATAMAGPDAPEAFYTPDRFTRTGAMPPSTLRLLQDKGSVQTLDGPEHRWRKAQFTSLLSDEAAEELASCFDGCWRRRLEGWPGDRPFVLLHEAERILCEAACAWAGAPVEGREAARRTQEFSAMVGQAGSVSPALAAALVLRQRNEGWARRQIRAQRARPAGTAESTPLGQVAAWTSIDGDLLPAHIAAIELVNLLRPTVAVARFVVFAALALHRRPRWRDRLASGDEPLLEAFAHEVRRYFPFFPAIAGRVRTPFRWNGRNFKTGEWVLTDLYGANHDARRWRDPARFDPERFLRGEGPEGITAQGGGDVQLDHRCPGEGFTVALIKAATQQLVTMDYRVPPQDLRLRRNRLPTAPESGFVMRIS